MKVTPKGRCFYNYLLKRRSNNPDYIEAYEDTLIEISKMADCLIDDAIDICLKILRST